MTDHLCQLRVGKLIGMFGTIHCDCSNRACVNELRDTCTLGGIEKIPGAADVRIVNVLLAFGPQAIISGNVKHTRDASKRASERRRVPQIAGDVFERQIGDRAIVAGRAQENAHVLAASDELPRDVAAKKPRSAGYERRHAQSPSSQAFSEPGDNFPRTGTETVSE